jgi:acyl-CoA synthetase (AMP-forming)/AMP-acid ligase II
MPTATGAPPSLIELLAAGATRGRIRFLPTDDHRAGRELWDTGAQVATWLRREGFDGEQRLGAIMASTPEAIACTYGAIQAGCTFVSLPTPPRAASLDWYIGNLRRVCLHEQIRLLVTDEGYLPLLPDLGVPAESFQTMCQRASALESQAPRDGFALIQFTSGSTGNPKGVVLAGDKIASNIRATLERLDLTRDETLCSWLPLTHDMGFVGMLLTAACAAAPEWVGSGELILITPETFLRDPSIWMEACSQFGATITGAPDFAYRMAEARRRPGALDLTRLRVCITGAEPVRSETLVGFQTTFRDCGFDPMAFTPAYGLAEAGLAVAMTSPSRRFASLTVDPVVLAGGELVESSTGRTLVSTGRPLTGYEVISAGRTSNAVGRLLIRGPSLLERYSDGSVAKDPNGWFHTDDLGFCVDGEVYIAGRVDDVLIYAGRKLYASDAESLLDDLPGLRPGAAYVSVDQTNAQFLVVAEPSSADESRDWYWSVARDIRARMAAQLDAGPAAVTFVAPGSIPKTASGKVQRHLLAARLDAGLDQVIEHIEL